MPKLNRNLIRSVLWDLKVISEVAGETMSWIGNPDCLSWRYPTQRSDTLDIPSLLKFRTRSPAEYYVLLLELVYDRFHFLFHLLIKFLDTIPAVREDYVLPPNVQKPQHQTLGALVSMFWNRMVSFQEHLLKHATDSDKHEKSDTQTLALTLSHDVSSRAVQTDMYSLLCCENCQLSEALIKHIVNTFEIFGNDLQFCTKISQEREQMKEAVFQISQWSAMQRWTEAISQDLSNLITKFTELRNKNLNFNKSLETKEQKHKREITQLLNKIKDLEENVWQLKSKIRHDEARHSSAVKQNRELETKITLQKEKMEKADKEIQDFGGVPASSAELAGTPLRNGHPEVYQENCKLHWKNEEEKLYSQLLELKQELETTINKNKSLNEESIKLAKKLKQAEENKEAAKLQLIHTKNLLVEKENCYKSQQKQSEDLDQINTDLKCEAGELNKQITLLKTENLALHGTVQNQQSTLEELQKKLHQNEKEKVLLLAYPDLNGPIRHNIVKDSPFQDMQAQLQANELRIQLLQEQNGKLQITLHKMSQFTTMKKGTL